MSKLYIGVDLGTTNSSCSLVVTDTESNIIERKRLPIYQLTSSPLSTNECYSYDDILPSIVWIKNSEVFTGKFCKDQIQEISTIPDSYIIKSIKSQLDSDSWSVPFQDSFLDPVDISAIILKTIANSIEGKYPNHEIESIIITIPSTFSSSMRRKTLRAARVCWKNKCKSIQLIDEPVAALFSNYNVATDKFSNIEEDQIVMIIDIGGGTNDVTILKQIGSREIQIMSSSRYNNLAGDDFDLEISALLLSKIKSDPTYNQYIELSDSRQVGGFISYLLNISEKIKKESFKKYIPAGLKIGIDNLILELKDYNERINIDFWHLFPGVSPAQITIGVYEILVAIKSYISKSDYINEIDKNKYSEPRNIFTPIMQALQYAGNMPKSFLSKIFITGGSSNFRPIRLELENFWSNNQIIDLDYSHSVSEGAALYCYLHDIKGWKVMESTREKIFIKRNGLPFLEIFPQNLPIPSDRNVLSFDSSRPMDSIVIEESTNILWLEFYSGLSSDDPCISFVHDIKMSLSYYLEKDTILSRVEGWIDSNKIYNFKLTFQNPLDDEMVYTIDVEFKSLKKDSKLFHKKSMEVIKINGNEYSFN